VRSLFIAFLLAVSFLPIGVFAADQSPADLLSGNGGGLVPNAENNQTGGAYYRACDVQELVQNVLNFSVAFSVIVATLMFAWAGILYVTAASNPEQVKKAHKVFGHIFVGLLLVLLAWLIVNILLSVLTGQGLEKWGHISCIANPTTSAFSGAPALGSVQGGGSPRGPSGGGGATGGRCSPMQSGICSPQNLTRYFGVNATTMSVVCHAESGGDPNNVSGGANPNYGKTADGKPIAIGLFQINVVSHNLSAPACGNVACTSAISRGRMSGNNYTGRVVNQNLYNACVAKLRDPTCNLQTAQQIFTQSSTGPWVGATDCNIR
jgi:hypothetical protein